MVIAISGIFGNILAVIVAAWLATREARRARQIAEATHLIVNNQRTIMLRALHALAARIAKENPSEEAAQLAAERTKADLAAAEK